MKFSWGLKNHQTNRHFSLARRHFLKKSSLLSSTLIIPTPVLSHALTKTTIDSTHTLSSIPLGFNGERRDPVTGCYHLGNGYRMYSPSLMRFQAVDTCSPFGKGGINAYAYCLGDPINQSDPSGHFALLSLLIGAIVGAIVGASISAVSEGIQCAVNPEHKFNWKQIGIGAALGFISGGFGAVAKGATTSVKVGLAIADATVSGCSDFGLNVAAGTPIKQAGLNAGMGVVIGLVTFGAGIGLNHISKMTKNSRFNFIFGRSGKMVNYKGVERTSLGSDFLLFKKANSTSDRLVVTAHGLAIPFKSFETDTKINFFAPHGKKLIDPGLARVMDGNFKPYEIIQAGGTTKEYLLGPYNSDLKCIPYSVHYTGVDVVAVRPGKISTNAHLMNVLKQANLHYAEIDAVHCRCHTIFGGDFEALKK